MNKKIEDYAEKVGEMIKWAMENVPQHPARDQVFYKLRESLFWVGEGLSYSESKEKKDD